jgi:hypothetical protein
MEQGGSDISQHQHACYRCRYGATSQIALSRSEYFVVFAVPETRFEPLGKVGGWLYRREVSEQEKRTADLGIVLRAALTFHQVSLHANQLDTGEGIVYESNVLITKLATVHGDRLRVR